METDSKENAKMIKQMEKELNISKMEINMKVTGKMMSWREKEYCILQMVHLLENLRIILLKESKCFTGKMETYKWGIIEMAVLKGNTSHFILMENQ